MNKRHRVTGTEPSSQGRTPFVLVVGSETGGVLSSSASTRVVTTGVHQNHNNEFVPRRNPKSESRRYPPYIGSGSRSRPSFSNGTSPP